jgi:hypothetical protein
MVNPGEELEVDGVSDGCRQRPTGPDTASAQQHQHSAAGQDELENQANVPGGPELEDAMQLHRPVEVQGHGIGGLIDAAVVEVVPTNEAVSAIRFLGDPAIRQAGIGQRRR